MIDFKKKALAAAIGVALTVPPATLMAAEVGNFFQQKGNSKLQIGVFYNHSSRDVKQEGTANLFSESEAIPSESPSETFTEDSSYDITGLKAKQDTDDVYLKISYAVTPKIEVYGKIGASSTDLDIDRDSGTLAISESDNFSEDGGPNISEGSTLTENTGYLPTDAFDTSQNSDTGWLVSVGTKVSIYETASGWSLGLDGQYTYREQSVGENFFGGGDWELDDHESHELQGSLLFGKVTGNFRPYGGISYTKFESEYDITYEDGPLPPFIDADGTLEFENKNNVGYFAGFDYDFSGFSASVEARAGDEESLTIGLTKSF